jgi:hypothetical protein
VTSALLDIVSDGNGDSGGGESEDLVEGDGDRGGLEDDTSLLGRGSFARRGCFAFVSTDPRRGDLLLLCDLNATLSRLFSIRRPFMAFIALTASFTRKNFTKP